MTATSTRGGGPARLLRVYGLWILLVTAVVVGGALAVSLRAAPEYASQASVIVEPRVFPNTTPVEPAMGTEKQVAQSGVVMDTAARSLGITTDELRGGLTIGVTPDANVLQFGYVHEDPAEAQRRAQAVAVAYVGYRNASESQETGTTKPAPTAARSVQHATLVTPAGLPAAPKGHTLWINIAAGLVIGLALGIGTALIRDRTSDRLRGREDFEQITGLSVLASVPRMRPARPDEPPIILRAPDSPAAESFRYLRSKVQTLAGRRGDGTAVLVTSAGEQEGRTTTAANVAAALALAGLDVILVDTDLRRPRLHTMFGVENNIGLASVLSRQSLVLETLRATTVPGLLLLPAGPPAGNAAELLSEQRLESAVSVLRSACDFVILDSAPVLAVADPVALAAVSDLVLLVADRRRTTRTFAAAALRELGEHADRVVGGVLINASKSAGRLPSRPAAAPVDSAPAPEIPDSPGELAPIRDPEADQARSH
jgi:capsular exopolysaccharide synthesis family protein